MKLQNSSNTQAPRVRTDPLASSALRFRILAGLGLIVITVFLAYQQSINGGFVLDDDIIVTENPNIKAADGLHRLSGRRRRTGSCNGRAGCFGGRRWSGSSRGSGRGRGIHLR